MFNETVAACGNSNRIIVCELNGFGQFWANAKDVPEIKQDLKDKTTKDAQQDTDIKVLKTRQDAILKNTEIILTKLDELSKDKNRSHNRNDDRNE